MATDRTISIAYEFRGIYCQREESYEREEDYQFLLDKKKEFVEKLECKGKVYPGLNAKGALNIYDHLLSPYEKVEINKFPAIYCLPDENNGAPEDAIKKKWFWEDGDDYKLAPGDHIAYRFKIEKKVGGCDSGRVAYAMDAKTKQKVAIKVMSQSAKQMYRGTQALLRLGERDPENVKNIVRLLHFDHFREAHYLVMDRYDTDLKAYMEEKYPKGMPLDVISRYGNEMLIALEYLAFHNMVHGDIKPNSFLLNRDKPFRVKLTDFTLARPQMQEQRFIKCQTMNYRAPEIFLFRKEKCPVDMWAFGCVLAEMLTNVVFFIGANAHDQFYLYLEVLGLPPDEFFKKKDTATFFFSTLNKVPIHVIHRNGKDQVDLEFSFAARRRKLPGATPLKTFFSGDDKADLLDFIRKTFKWIPRERITPEAAKKHSFFEGYNVAKIRADEEGNSENDSSGGPSGKGPSEKSPVSK